MLQPLLFTGKEGVWWILAVQSHWGCSAQALQGSECSSLCIIYTVIEYLADEMQPGPVVWLKAEMGLEAEEAK